MSMDPSYLPELALLIAGVIVAGVAIHRLTTREWRRAAALAAASVALVALAFVSGRSSRIHPTPSRPGRQATRRHALMPADVRPPRRDPDEGPGMSLILGGVRLSVPPSNRYVLSVENEPFLILDSLGTGLLASCEVADWQTLPLHTPRRAADIAKNAVSAYASGVESSTPDSSTLVVTEQGEDVFRIRYVDPRSIEVHGRFYLSKGPRPGLISMMDGVEWRGARIRPGATIDLTPQGKGRIDFERSGMIRVVDGAGR
jgi:hypothetical protein